jgi:hypothetical protein
MSHGRFVTIYDAAFAGTTRGKVRKYVEIGIRFFCAAVLSTGHGKVLADWSLRSEVDICNDGGEKVSEGIENSFGVYISPNSVGVSICTGIIIHHPFSVTLTNTAVRSVQVIRNRNSRHKHSSKERTVILYVRRCLETCMSISILYKACTNAFQAPTSSRTV